MTRLNKEDQIFWNSLSKFLLNFGLNIYYLSEEQKYTLITAFTHKSYANENKSAEHNDYLEFIGDGVLQFIVTAWIAKKNPSWDSGFATQLRSSIVDKNNLSDLAEEYELFKYLRHSKAAFINGINKKTISNLYEAFIGAIYVVFGINVAMEVTKQTLGKTFDSHYYSQHSHPKNVLQEHFQQSSTSNVVYTTEKLPNNTFRATVMFEWVKYGEGIGYSKKEAETNAAIDALKKLKTIVK
ncbi:Ribonuclease III [Metamycoplasma auris 15026]|uniref:Ribonuclease 3 n=1 Tax=Metamycoplasma auris 15026 TaxID=1188233 RepID=N9VCH4_9BACT|nr:ribonuclease III [Metamycoplasma auris]ENY69388.1 Ribonuclease III [Metamycoplasma auris 15026]